MFCPTFGVKARTSAEGACAFPENGHCFAFAGVAKAARVEARVIVCSEGVKCPYEI